MKEYIDKEKILRIIDNAMFQAKSYDGGLDADTALRILNNMKLYIKTMETVMISEKEIYND